jgi:hypothetical protein
MKFLKLFIALASLVCAVSVYMYMTKVGTETKNSSILTKTPQVKAENTANHYNGAMPGMKNTYNQMGYEDTEINLLLQKYLEFIPHAPGKLLDLGCAWGFAIQQVLTIEKQIPFLKQHNRNIIAIDLEQKHLDQVAANTPPEMVETINMHFPNCDSQQCIKTFAPESLGATYAGLFLHYLNPAELTQGLKLLYDATATECGVYASVNSAFIAQLLAEDFLRRKKNPDEPFPGWYPNVLDKSVP